MIQDVKANFFQAKLQACRDVTLAISQRGAGCAHWTKRAGKLVGKHTPYDRRTLVPGHLHTFRVMTEVVEIKSKLPVLFGAYNVAKDLYKSRLSVRRQSHHLALVAVMRKTEKLSGGRVDDTS